MFAKSELYQSEQKEYADESDFIYPPSFRSCAMKPRLRIALISPKGPLYRKSGGIFKQSLRYMPLTFPTLVSLIPDDINADVNCYDEGIEDIPDQINADLVGITVITGTAKRAYQLADRFRREGKTVVLGVFLLLRLR